MKRVLRPELQQRQIKERVDTNLFNANVKLVDENKFLKEDNEKLINAFIEVKGYINSQTFKKSSNNSIKETLNEIIGGINYE